MKKKITFITIKKDWVFISKTGIFLFMVLLHNLAQAQVFYNDTDAHLINSIEGSATWTQSGNGDFLYDNNGVVASQRAMLYSQNAYQSEDGFKLTIEYTSGSIEDDESNNFSFGLISDETDLSTYSAFNPFKTETSVYSVGVNLTTDGDATARGMNFTNASNRITLDQSGSRAQFDAGKTTKVTFEIGIGGYWSYRINDVYENSGVLLEGFDLSKNFHVVVYGQDDNGGEKSIQSIQLEKRYAAGERATHIRGTWNSEIHVSLLDDRIKNLKTLDRLGVSFTNGAVLSAEHKVPHKLFDMLAGGDAVAPAWGDLNSDSPDHDNLIEDIMKIKEAGFNVKAYTNSENFVGPNADYLQPFVDSWMAYCDNDPEVQAFINSQPYHTGIWNSTTQQYEDATATYPLRKYMFCYAEFFLKDYALRYGEHFDSWIFDDGGTMEQMGDNATSGVIEEQRIYQAYANAVHAGNPDIPIAFNNSRSTVNYDSYPFAHAVRFEDFTFGHAFGGNNNHAEKVTGNQFNSNYKHVTRMTLTNGYVHDGGNWTWDDKIVGNFHSKLSTTAWKYGATQAWEQDDFNQWNLEAVQAGGSMTWGGSFNRAETSIYDWVYVLLEGLDNYLMANENPGPPNWSRAYTLLPPAYIGQAYQHTLIEGEDFWDPEGDAISAVLPITNAPSWLTITEDASNPGHWILSGVPDEASETLHQFELQATDANSESGVRSVELQVNKANTSLTDPGDGTPVWVSDVIDVELPKFEQLAYTLTRGVEFEDFDGDALTISILSGASWVTLQETAPNVWNLDGVTECSGLNEIVLELSDGINKIETTVAINVVAPQFLGMEMNTIQGASWNLEDDGLGNETYNFSSPRQYYRRAVLYSTDAFQSDEGFELKVNYDTGILTNSGAHNFSFGLVSADTDLANYQGLDPVGYTGLNPFANDTSVYSLGVNLTLNLGAGFQGLNFTDGTAVGNLDVSGTNVQFVDANVPTEVAIKIGKNGEWSYSIAGIEEASGVISGGFDLTKSYHVVIFGQDDNGGGKTIHSVSLNTCLDDGTLGTDDLSEATSLDIYPNPVSTTFQIRNQQGSKIEIYNLLGVLQHQEVVLSNNHTINAQSLVSGMYLVKVINGDDTAVRKIIKR
ncbi:T9SS type A sorting domain-containing protein [Tamlana agarivorans]|uniref:T9SS type A sorting domain-containing protein n=1 Tax=Pseudotamlana agarivorans TaxID=481183 RepID=A0ACC5U9B3_9FLAO|nr:T9SS type A sorting domain-containing protein [Tamlana agarivorans]MBU2950924.1 T9SS type A sorting domain-containing protein [Tamlana agarivorans]